MDDLVEEWKRHASDVRHPEPHLILASFARDRLRDTAPDERAHSPRSEGRDSG